MNEELVFILKNIDDNISILKTHGDDLKTSFDELKNESTKYHTIVDNLRIGDKELNKQLTDIIKNEYRIENVEKRVDRLSNIAKHGFIAGVAVTFIMGTIAFFAKTSNYFSRIIN